MVVRTAYATTCATHTHTSHGRVNTREIYCNALNQCGIRRLSGEEKIVFVSRHTQRMAISTIVVNLLLWVVPVFFLSFLQLHVGQPVMPVFFERLFEKNNNIIGVHARARHFVFIKRRKEHQTSGTHISMKYFGQ